MLKKPLLVDGDDANKNPNQKCAFMAEEQKTWQKDYPTKIPLIYTNV